MCTDDYSCSDLNTMHQELGHTQYQQQYSHLPYVFQDGANDGFHEAIGELMALAGSTPKHLYDIGLMKVMCHFHTWDFQKITLYSMQSNFRNLSLIMNKISTF